MPVNGLSISNREEKKYPRENINHVGKVYRRREQRLSFVEGDSMP